MHSRKISFAKISTIITVALALLATSGCAKLMARDELNKGVQAYKASKFESAIEHFKNAIAKDLSRSGKAVSGDRLRSAVRTWRRFAGEHAVADCAIEQYQKVLEEPGAPEDHARAQHQGIGFALLQHEEVRSGQGVRQEGHRSRS